MLIYGGKVFEHAVDLVPRLMAEAGLYPGHALYYYVSMPSPGNFPVMRDVYGRMRLLTVTPTGSLILLVFEGLLKWLLVVRPDRLDTHPGGCVAGVSPPPRYLGGLRAS